jgi:hypothetical protein
VNVSSPTGVPDDDAYWQRPEPGSTGPDPAPGPAREPAPTPQYEGPPRSTPPHPQWRPPTIAQPPPPREMPSQDIDALEESEGSARTVTYGIGLVAGAVALLLLCLLCGRLLF